MLEKLTALCLQKVGITTGQILEYWRDDKEYGSPLEILAVWDHLIDDDKVEDTFRETLKYFYLQLIDKNIEKVDC